MSKTKLGAIILGLSIVLPAIAAALETGHWQPVVQPALEAAGVVLAGFGLRNAITKRPMTGQ